MDIRHRRRRTLPEKPGTQHCNNIREQRYRIRVWPPPKTRRTFSQRINRLSGTSPSPPPADTKMTYLLPPPPYIPAALISQRRLPRHSGCTTALIRTRLQQWPERYCYNRAPRHHHGNRTYSVQCPLSDTSLYRLPRLSTARRVDSKFALGVVASQVRSAVRSDRRWRPVGTTVPLTSENARTTVYGLGAHGLIRLPAAARQHHRRPTTTAIVYHLRILSYN